VNGTYISDQFSGDFITQLNILAENIKQEYQINIWFVEILNRRWSYIAGICEPDQLLPPQRIELGSNLGLVSNDLINLTPELQQTIINEITEFVNRNI